MLVEKKKFWHEFRIFYRNSNGILCDIVRSFPPEDTSFYEPGQVYSLFGKGLVVAGVWVPPGAIVSVEFLGRD